NAGRRGQRRLVDAETESGRLRVGLHRGRAPLFGPVHRTDIEFGPALELPHALARDLDHRLYAHHRLQPHRPRRTVEAGAMLVEVGRHALEGPRAVEHARAEPEGVGARANEGRVALDPLAVEKGESLRPGGHSVRALGPGTERGGARQSPFCVRQSSGTMPSASAPRFFSASPTRLPPIVRSGAISANGTSTNPRLKSP